MKWLSSVLLFVLATICSGQESNTPPTVPVRILLRYGTPVGGTASADIGVNAEGPPTTYLFASDPRSLGVIEGLFPGKTYNMYLTAVNIQSFYKVYISPPQGYKIYLNEIEQSALSYTATGYVTVPSNVAIRVEKVDQEVLAVGETTELRPGKTVWSVGLGKLKNGSSAGALKLCQLDSYGLSYDLFDLHSIFWSSSSSEIQAYYSSTTTSYQIFANECLVQLDQLPAVGLFSPGFTISYFDRSQVSSTISADGLWNINPGENPMYKYTIQRAKDVPSDPNHSIYSLLISKTARVNSSGHSTVRNTYTQLDNVDPTALLTTPIQFVVKDWTTNAPDSNNGIAAGESWKRWTYTNYDWVSQELLTEEIETFKTSGQVKAADVVNNYKIEYWGKELISTEEGHGDAHPLVTNFTYNEDYNYFGSYTQKLAISEPTGNWIRFSYYDDDLRLGLLKTTYSPFGDLGSSATAADYANGLSTNYDYSFDYTGLKKSRIMTVSTKINNIQAGLVSTSYVDSVIPESVYSGGTIYTVNRAVTTATIKNYSSATSFVTSSSEYYGENAGMGLLPNGNFETTKGFLPLQMRSKTFPTGVKETTTYQLGLRTNDFWNFVPIASGVEWLITKTMSANGTLVDGGSTQSNEVRGYNGRTVLSWESAYVGGAWVRFRSSRAIGLALRPDRMEANSGTVSGNMWTTESFLWDGGQLVRHVDASGSEHVFTYKDDGRIATDSLLPVVGLSSFLPSNSLVTAYEYDGAGRVLSIRRQKAATTSSEDFVASTTFDLAGRKTSSTELSANGAVTTTYSYFVNLNPRVSSVTLPSGATKMYVTCLDGRPKYESGTALYGGTIQDSYSYGIEAATGNVWAKASKPTGAYSLEVHDWASRTVRRTENAYNNVRTAVVYGYDSTAGWLTKSQVVVADASDNASFTSAAVSAPKLYNYDSLGRLKIECVDVNEDGIVNLTATSKDRITEYSYAFNVVTSDFVVKNPTYAFVAGATVPVVWSSKEVRTYLDSSAVSSRISTELISLNRFAVMSGSVTSIVAQSQTRNALYSGPSNEANTVTYVNSLVTPSTKQVSLTRLVPNISNRGVILSANNFVYSVTDVDGTMKTTQYDAYGRVDTVSGRDSVIENYTYYPGTTLVRNIRNAVLKPSNLSGLEWQTNSYDFAGRVTQHQVYDTGSFVNTYYDYDLRGNVLHVWGNGSIPVRYEYYDYNRLKTSFYYRDQLNTVQWNTPTWPGAAAVSSSIDWNYDVPTGLLTSKTYPATVNGNNVSVPAKSVSYTYNTLNLVASRTGARGRTTSYTYYGGNDSNGIRGELSLINYPAADTPSVSYKYRRTGQVDSVDVIDKVTDANGNIVSSVTRTSSYGYRTEDLQPLSETLDATFQHGYIIKRDYDSSIGWCTGFRLGTSSTPAQFQTTAWGFEPNTGRLSSVTGTNNGVGSAARSFSFTYHPNSNLIEGVASGTTMSRTNSWETWRNVPDVVSTVTGVTPSTVARFQYDYDWMGRVIGEATTGSLVGTVDPLSLNGFRKHYLYTAKGELDTSSAFRMNANQTDSTTVLPAGSNGVRLDHDWNYDNVGNRFSDSAGGVLSSYIVNDLNQLTKKTISGASTVMLYDDDGNLTSDGRWTYIWDSENRLIKMWEAAGPNAQTLTFKYDHLNRRVSKSVSVNGGTVSTTKFIWDGWNLIAEYNENAPATMVREYTWGLDLTGGGSGGVGGLLMGSQSAKNLMPLYDSNGTIHGYIDDNGNLQAAFDMTAFGELRVSSGTSQLPFQFATKYFDSETGLVQYNNRYYHSGLGRFINRDPSGEAGGLNLYAYCGNDGVNKSDYLGLNGNGEVVVLGPMSVDDTKPRLWSLPGLFSMGSDGAAGGGGMNGAGSGSSELDPFGGWVFRNNKEMLAAIHKLEREMHRKFSWKINYFDGSGDRMDSIGTLDYQDEGDDSSNTFNLADFVQLVAPNSAVDPYARARELDRAMPTDAFGRPILPQSNPDDINIVGGRRLTDAEVNHAAIQTVAAGLAITGASLIAIEVGPVILAGAPLFGPAALKGTEAARAALGKGPFANPGAPLTTNMRSALETNLAAAQYNLSQAMQGLNHAGSRVSAEQAARAAQTAQNRINEIQRILASGVQAPKI